MITYSTMATMSKLHMLNDLQLYITNIVPKAVVDQKISQVCAAARVKVSYNCQNGECGTCELKVNGRKARACVAKVPSGKCAITTN